MSVKSTRRFDKYIPLFGKDNDDRVALLLGELQDVAIGKKNTANRKNFVAADIGLDSVTTGLQNQNFNNPDSKFTDTDPHPEWKDFMLQLGVRLNNKKFTDARILSIVKSLKNAAIGSLDEFILVTLSKIATFKNGATASDKDMIAYKSLLDQATEVNFKSDIEIITELTTDKVMNTGTEDHMLITGLSLNAGNDLTPSNKRGIIMISKYDEGGKSRLSDKFEAYINGTRGTNFLTMSAVASAASDKIAFIATLKDFINSLDIVNNFNYNLDKYLKNKLFDAQHAILPVFSGSRFFDDPIVDQGKYWRKADGSLWTVDVTGKEVQVDINSQKFKDLKATDKCLGTNVNDLSATGGKSCADYLRDCLSGNDVQKCVEYLKKEEYWNTVEKEVDEMLPAIALKTLESFEFKTVETYDESNKMSIRKVITVTDWLAGLLKMVKAGTSLDDAAYQAIAKNEKLKGYLALLVKKVNSNPAILNRGITKSDEQKRYNPNAFSGSKLASMGVKPRIPGGSLAPSSIERLAHIVRAEQDAIRIRLMGPAIMGGILTGGSAQIDDIESRISTEHKQTWALFQIHYLALVDQLKNMGKDIAKEDKNKIQELFDQLKKSEVKLMQIMLMTEKYKDLIQIHGEKDSNSQLTVDHLKQFVDQRNKYFTRVAKKQNDLISIIKSISEAVQKEAPTKTEPLADVKLEKLALAGLLG